MSEEYDDKPIRGDVLRDALRQFDSLGTSMKELLIQDIEAQGIVLDDKHYYALRDIAKRFDELFSKDVTPLLIERIKRILGDSKMLIIASAPIVQFALAYNYIGTIPVAM